MGFLPVATSVLLFATGGFFVFVAYALLARGMGMRDLSFGVFGHVYFVGQLLKYLPGRVWGFAFQVARASDLARPSRWAAVLTIHFVSAVGALVAIAALIEAVAGGLSVPWLIFGLASSVLATAALALEWRTFRWRLSLSMAAATSGLLHLGALLQAFALVPLVLSLDSNATITGALREGGHYLLAWLAGYVAIIAPAGLGVREVAYAALSEGLAGEVMLTVAAIARLAMMMADLLLGLVFLRYPSSPLKDESPIAKP